jgi:hypothetical protein
VTTAQKRRPATAARYAGLVLTVVVTLAPYVDRATRNVLARHIRHGYPDHPPERVDSETWARAAAAARLAVGGSVASAARLVEDTSGETGLPPLLRWIGMLLRPAGLAAVAILLEA